MTSIRVTTIIDAPADEVWDDVRHIERHVEWMVDAKAIRLTTDEVEGPGVEFECDTQVGPFHMTDHMKIVGWVEGRSIRVRHTGIVSGEGEFVVSPVSHTTTEFSWAEDLHFPWWMGGPIGGLLAGWIFRLIWTRNLKALRRRFD